MLISKTKKIITIVTLLLCVLSILLIMTFNHSENEVKAEQTTVLSTDLSKYVDWETKKTLLNTKFAVGIDGETLIVLEYYPVGYAIYDLKGELWERNEDAPSPYINSNGDVLVYAGPTQYFEKVNENTLLNTYTKEKTTINEKIRASICATAKSVANIKKQANKNMLSSPYSFNGQIIGYGSVGGVLANTNTSGANQGGICGGVAAALVLHYFDQKYPNKNINTDDSFSSLLNKLKKYGDLSKSTADTIKPIVKKYLAANGSDCLEHTSLLGLFTTNSFLTDQIDRGNPVILFAAVQDPSVTGSQSIMHAIVAHTYHIRSGALGTKKYSYVCHFGWGPQYNKVEVHNAVKYITVGTSYTMGLKR